LKWLEAAKADLFKPRPLPFARVGSKREKKGSGLLIPGSPEASSLIPIFKLKNSFGKISPRVDEESASPVVERIRTGRRR